MKFLQLRVLLFRRLVGWLDGGMDCWMEWRGCLGGVFICEGEVGGGRQRGLGVVWFLVFVLVYLF